MRQKFHEYHFLLSKVIMNHLDHVRTERNFLEEKLNLLISKIGDIPIANNRIMPFGWRKAAKGRTVWRIIEEIITQNSEVHAQELGFREVRSAESEVDVFDMEFTREGGEKAYVNIKSTVDGAKRNKDDISKASGLREFFSRSKAELYVATFVLRFHENMTISILKCVVCPISWIPDLYINPGNNGNLQSADYKFRDKFVEREKSDFIQLFETEYQRAMRKRKNKIDKS